MKKIISVTLLICTLLGLIGCQSLWYPFLNANVDIAPDRFVFENKDLPGLSSFEVIDRLIEAAVKLNPGIRRILILGHSAGAQFIVRFAATNGRHELLEQQGISIRYVVANSSSYPYLDQTRFHFNPAGEMRITSSEELLNCPGYNKYKYGLEER